MTSVFIFWTERDEVFEKGGSSPPPEVDLKVLHAKIGQLTLENDFFEGTLANAGMLSA